MCFMSSVICVSVCLLFSVSARLLLVLKTGVVTYRYLYFTHEIRTIISLCMVMYVTQGMD